MFVFSIITISSIVLAQNRADSITLSPFFGGYKFDSDQYLDDNIYFGLRTGYNFTKYLGAEAMFGYVPTETERNSRKGYLMNRDNQNVNVYRYGIEGLFHFMPDYKFDPFIAAGYGRSHLEYSGGIKDHDFGLFDYGVGLNYHLTKNVAIRADVRHDLFRESGHTFNNLEYTAGLTFQFGGEEKPEVTYTPKSEAPARRYTPEMIPTPEPTPEPKPEIVLIELDDIHFKHDKSELTEVGKEIVNENIETLKENPDIDILIAGYCSASGSDEYNQKLSERRATAVRDYLIKEGGIAPERLTKIGYGESRPAEYESHPKVIESKAAKANRRVLFTIIVK